METQGQRETNSCFPSSLIPVFIFAIIFLVFKNALGNGFVEWDDNKYIYNNYFIRSFSLDNLREMFVSSHTGNWHPVTWLSHAIDFQLFGLNPTGHHFIGIVLHAINAVWVYFIFIRLASIIQPRWIHSVHLCLGGMAAALIYGCHPLRVESVVWASERKDLLSAFFILPAFLTYLKFTNSKKSGNRLKWYLLTAALFILALMSKSMVVTFPIVLIIFDLFLLNRMAGVKFLAPLLIEKIPFFILSLVFGVLAIFSQDGSGAMVPVESLTLDTRLLNAMRAVIFYIGKTLWPQPLVPLYPFPKNLSLASLNFIFAFAVFLALTIFCLKMWKKKKPLYLAAWLYYLVTVLPVIGIIQVGRQGAADRYTYLPTLSLFLLVGSGVAWLFFKYSQIFKAKVFYSLVIICSLPLVGLAFITDRQIGVWKNTETFSEHIIKTFPNRVAMAHFKLARVYRSRGWQERAEREYHTALKINPNYSFALNDLGLMAMKEGRLDQAEDYFRSGLEVQPDDIFHTNLGTLLMRKKQFKLAEEYILKALDKNPEYPDAHNNLGMVYLHFGKLEKGENHFISAIKLNPRHMQAYANLGVLYKRTGRLAKAEAAIIQALTLDPTNPDILNLLGEVYLQAGMVDRATIQFNEALRLKPDHPSAQANLKRLAPAKK